MALTQDSDYESYASISAFPSTGAVDTFYLDRTSISGDNEPPIHGNLYIWDGTQYVFYATLQDNSFLGPRPAHPPHYN